MLQKVLKFWVKIHSGSHGLTDLANLKGAHPYQYRHLLEAYTPARFKVGQMIGSFGILMGMVVAIYRNVDDDKNINTKV